MLKSGKKKIILYIASLLCVIMLFCCWGDNFAAYAMVFQPPAETDDSDEASQTQSYTQTIGDCTIGEGQTLEYTTISSQFAGGNIPEGMYPGELTVEITGQIVIESGGCLSIGTLSIGGTDEAHPVISGTLSDQGLIVVKPGGKLILNSVEFDLQGQGFVIVQQPGGSVELTDTVIQNEFVQWAPETVNNLNDQPDDIWLEEGTVLTQQMLPKTLKTTVEYQGKESDAEVSVLWDLSGYTGITQGEVVVTGTFVNESGQVIQSILPLQIKVQWYSPERLVVTKAEFKGNNACSAELTVLQLPEGAQVWGEISEDEGKTWSVFDDVEILSVYDSDSLQSQSVVVFYVEDNTPLYYRVAASNVSSAEFWVSDGFLLPNEESEDQGGNFGGSISPVTPDRQPEEETATDTTTDQWSSAWALDDSEDISVKDENQPEDSQSDNQNDVQTSQQQHTTDQDEDMTQQQQDDSDLQHEQPEANEKVLYTKQVIVIVAGFVVCIAGGVVTAVILRSKRKR